MQIELTKKQIEQIEKNIIRDVWKTVDKDDFLRVVGDKLCQGNIVLNDKDKMVIKEGAKTIVNTRTWNLLMNEMLEISNKKMVEESKCWEDMIFGKACLYIMNVMQKKLDNLANLKTK